jgi:hypothetical protein
MLYSYQDCVQKYGTDYKIKKELQEGRLFMKEKGIYSDNQYVPELEIIAMKYPNAILTLNSAFYYYGLTDTIPDYYYIATPKGKRKITDPRIKQIFDNSDAVDLGVTTIEHDGINVTIYNKERLLIELIRNKSKISFDLYKELISSYRKIINDLDVAEISDYAYLLPKTRMVMETIRKEVL